MNRDNDHRKPAKILPFNKNRRTTPDVAALPPRAKAMIHKFAGKAGMLSPSQPHSKTMGK